MPLGRSATGTSASVIRKKSCATLVAGFHSVSPVVAS
jgi:hypothetical protein